MMTKQKMTIPPLPELPLSLDSHRKVKLAIEGYRFYAQEAIEFASASAEAVAETFGETWNEFASGFARLEIKE